MKKQYNKNKLSKVGDECICPSCGTKFNKVNYQQAFCKTKAGTICKDYYWNNVTETKRNNTTRISPKSKMWLQQREEKRENRWEYDDDQSWDAHKDFTI